MITLEDLENNSLKSSLTKQLEEFKKKKGYRNQHIRSPDTVVGLMSVDKANEVVFGENQDMLGHCRLVVSTYRMGAADVTFLSDDPSFAWCPEKGWPSFISTIVSIGMEPRPGLEEGIASCVEQLLFNYCCDEIIIDTKEELLAYMNDQILPSREELRCEIVNSADERTAMLAIETKNADGEWWRAGTHTFSDAFKKFPFSKYVWTKYHKG